MTFLLLLFLPCVFGARTRMYFPGNGTATSTEPSWESRKVMTTMGKECKFPFRQGGRLHHHCITILSSRPWCSLTSNFDRDGLYGYCKLDGNQLNITDSCQVNRCQNGGVCMLVPHRQTSMCSCTDGFSGPHCEQRRCYETLHQRYYDTGASWGRIHLRNVEQCTCVAGEISCERVRYTMCRSNTCHNGGTCRLITSTGKEVCNCRHGFSGSDCGLEPEAKCYNGRGKSYRGLASTTVSGARCLPWNSELMHNELHVGTLVASSLRGLGEHAFCRNPDGDKAPWCYTLSNDAISWEYCDVPPCVMSVSSSRRVVTFHKPNPTKPTKKPVCGKKHKKRLSIARGRILGGTSALPGTHPWIAAIYIGKSDFCAGTLISSCWIISAAHCFFRNPLRSQIRVVLGQHHFNVTSPNTRSFEVEEYIFPKKFSAFNPTLHDIVLIRLKKQDGRCVRRTPFIQPICLPDKSTTFPDNYCCTISGWGHKHETAPGYSSLQEGNIRLISRDFCKRPGVYGNHVTSDMLCAGLDGCVDACQGDSGGPLSCARDDVNFLYGIVSWGEGCGRTQKPGVYTKVVNYIDWINAVIRRKPKKS
uniref:trypsin n=2 Tax=Cynoglossus semilaevis TaxID=244447 RepID=A0A3P8UU95_CYNSE